MKATLEFDLLKEEASFRSAIAGKDMAVTLIQIQGLYFKALEEEWDKGRIMDALEKIFDCVPYKLDELIE